MKKTFLSLVAAVAVVGFVSAQTVQIPEFKNSPVLLKADGSLEKLEKQNIKTMSSFYMHAFMFVYIAMIFFFG